MVLLSKTYKIYLFNVLFFDGEIKVAQIIEKRKKNIESYVDVKNAHILEIGALDSPTYDDKKYHIKFLDYTSKEELAKKGDSNPRYRLESLVNVDYVCPTPEYSKYFQENFDLVIANHVIEHIPDMIRWLDELYNLLSPGGYLFLSVPDKRYTFDIVRRNTTVVDLLRNHEESIKKPNFYNILEHFYYHKSVSASDVWSNDFKEKLGVKRYELEEAIDVAKKHSLENYADVHCHVFTTDSFCELFEELGEINKIKFGVMNHFLEHIPNIQDVNIIVKKACSIIDDFLLIRQPYYDADPYLFSNGFKFYWSNWRGHPNHMTLLEFHNMLMPLVTEGLIKSFSLYGMSPVTSSEDSAIHNIDSMIDQHGWNKKEHTPKRNIEFSIPVYKEVLAIVDLSGNSTDKVISKLKPFVKLYSSDNETTK